MGTIFLFGLGLLCVIAGWLLVCELAPPDERSAEARRLIPWLGKGLALPMALWTLMNIGITWDFPPFIPRLQAAKNLGKGWLPLLFYVLAIGFFVISSSWATTTIGWRLSVAWANLKGEPRLRFKDLTWVCALLLFLPALALVWGLGWAVFPLAMGVVLGTIAGFAPPILHARPRPPAYSRAIARMKFGKYSEAEWEIIRELEKSEDDFQGWMMLADLYAHHFHDLKEAERTVLDICTRPQTTAPEISIALHKLADWNLKLANDLEGARFALGLILERLPGTHLARMAQLRIDQLADSLDEINQRKGTRAAVRLPALGDSLDEEPLPAMTRLERRKAADEANAFVERLKQDPNNVPARENFARLLAERLDRADLAIEQLTLLLDLPEQPDSRRAEWLGLVAAWNLKYLHDPDAGRIFLERILAEYPHTPQALAARRRIQLLDSQARQK